MRARRLHFEPVAETPPVSIALRGTANVRCGANASLLSALKSTNPPSYQEQTQTFWEARLLQSQPLRLLPAACRARYDRRQNVFATPRKKAELEYLLSHGLPSHEKFAPA